MSRPSPVLLVDADRRFGEAVARQLMADGYSVELARSARHARLLAAESRPCLALIGRLHSPREPLALLEEIRGADADGDAWDRHLPALVIGAGADELDLLRAFDAGADDFVAMPVGYLELRARMAALLRRSAGPAETGAVLRVGALRIDTLAREVRLAGRALPLRRMEYELLEHLARDPDRVFPREELLRSVWGYRCAGSTRTLDTHASRLRLKLGEAGRWVVCVRGVGYRLR